MRICRFFLVFLSGITLSSCGSPAIENTDSTVTIVWNQVPDKCTVRASPGDRSCTFYSDCLEGSVACQQTDSKYAISYGQKYCEKFSSLSNVSAETLEWRDGTLACLQNALKTNFVYNTPSDPHSGDGGESLATTCKNIKDVAFDSHSSCYLGKDYWTDAVTHRSICSISWFDVDNVARVVESEDLLTAQSAKQMIKVAKTCITELIGIQSSETEPTRKEELRKRITFWKSKEAEWSKKLAISL